MFPVMRVLNEKQCAFSELIGIVFSAFNNLNYALLLTLNYYILQDSDCNASSFGLLWYCFLTFLQYIFVITRVCLLHFSYRLYTLYTHYLLVEFFSFIYIYKLGLSIDLKKLIAINRMIVMS